MRTTENTRTLRTPTNEKKESRLSSGVAAKLTLMSAKPARIADKNNNMALSIIQSSSLSIYVSGNRLFHPKFRKRKLDTLFHVKVISLPKQ